MVSPNASSRGRARPRFVVLHYTGMADAQMALAKLCDPAPVLGRYRHTLPAPWNEGPASQPLGRVSAHYFITSGGRVHALVPEVLCAWHAGVSDWAGMSGLNRHSIGIELANGGHDFGLPPFRQPQVDALIRLLAGVRARWNISARNVIGHQDIQPLTKRDPGPLFPWHYLAKHGHALRRHSAVPATASRVLARVGQNHAAVLPTLKALSAVGYRVDHGSLWTPRNAAVLGAFIERFTGQEAEDFPQTPLRKSAVDLLIGRGRGE
jgi:N-acetyl-anhydromuramyl-L-alanine amidase AmpD